MTVENMLAVCAVFVFYATGFWLFLRRPSSKNKGISTDVQNGADMSVFGRKRLPRGEPHLWADRIEDWFARLTLHVYIHYVLIIILIGYVIFDLITDLTGSR